MTDINIYGVLHNDTPENTVAKAGQIRDDELEMQQSEINADFKKRLMSCRKEEHPQSQRTEKLSQKCNFLMGKMP